MNVTLRDKIPWGLVGAVVALLAVETTLSRLDLTLTRTANVDLRLAHRAASRKAPGCDVLCFGTSMVQGGIYPAVIERGAGLRAHNLAVGGGRTSYGYYYLRQALASGARPSAVLVDFHPAFLKSPYDLNNGWADVLGFRDCVDLAWTMKDYRFFVTTLLDKAFPSVYNRLAIRDAVLGALRGEPGLLRLDNLKYLRNHRRNKGALVGVRNPLYRGEMSDNYRQILLDRPFGCCPEEERYIHRFLDLAASHGIRVYWMVMPLAPALQHGREVKGRDDEYTRFVQSFRGYPNLVVIDGRRSGYPTSVFTDACHLDPQGGNVLSADVAEVLRRDLVGRAGGGGRRWVDLPAFRDRPVDVRLEDMAESGLALGRAGSARR